MTIPEQAGAPLTEPPPHEIVTLTEDDAPLFAEDGGLYVPLPIAFSPWHAETVNGAAVAGLLATGLEGIAAETGLAPVRLVIDILGRVPAAPLQLATRWERPGRRIGLVVAELLHDGRAAARATCLLVREEETPAFPTAHGHPLPGATARSGLFSRTPFGRRIETHRIYGEPHAPGDGALWAALNMRVLADRALGPLVCAAIIADTGSGVGNRLERARWTYPNLDITIHFSRLPRGRWLLVESSTTMAGNGHGIARAALGDEDGVFACSFQSLFVSPRA